MQDSRDCGGFDGALLPAALLASSAGEFFPNQVPPLELERPDRLAAFAGELAALSPALRDQVVQMLDRISRPMGPREIEHALRAAGIPRSQQRALAKALKGFSIVAIVDDEGDLEIWREGVTRGGPRE
jgi:hypothetical protein